MESDIFLSMIDLDYVYINETSEGGGRTAKTEHTI